MLHLRKPFTASVIATCVALATPAAASAETWYVDEDTGNDANVCNVPASSCDTIQQGVDNADPGDTVQADGGTYAEDTDVAEDITLLGQEFTGGDGASEGQPVIDGGMSNAVFIVPPGGATVTGFTLLGDSAGVVLSAEGTITANSFSEAADNSAGVRIGGSFTAGTIVSGNTFTDDTTAGEVRVGVELPQEGSSTISDNIFSNLSNPIFLGGGAGTPGSPTITGNEISGTRQTIGGGIGIDVLEGTPVLAANHIHSPIAPGATGIRISQGTGSGTSPTGATLRRNRIFDHAVGVDVLNNLAPVSLHSDAIVDSGDTGLQTQDTVPTAVGEGDVTATNVTITGTNTDIYVIENVLTLDSSLLGDATTGVFNAGGAMCSITYSRGPTTTPGGDGCANFQTSAPPGLAGDGYHLLATSPMIDLGDPAAPVAPNNLDIDGGSRAVLNFGSCTGPNTPRRDIGADESNAITTPACAGPPASPPSTPPAPPAKKKKCKKKGKKGAAAAKKCKRKKRK